MIAAFTAEQVHAAEASLMQATPPGSLMLRAATGLASVVLTELRRRRGRATGARVLLLVGPGNNGGDTLHAGAVLARRGVSAIAVASGRRVHAEGAVAFRAAGGEILALAPGGPGREVTLAEVVALARRADVICDGLLGIGGSGPLREYAAALVTTLSVEANLAPPQRYRVAGRPLVVAVDLPSGIGVDDGTVDGPVLQADVTVTFGAHKPAALLPPASREFGRIETIDIGVADVLAANRMDPFATRMQDVDILSLWPVPQRAAHKYTRGVLGVVAGSETYPGAAVLTTAAAVRAGVGMVRYLGPDRAVERVLSRRPEVVPGGGRVDAWALGPGVAAGAEDQLERLRRALKWAVSERVPTVVDAGGFAELPDHVAPWMILTPHAGELARLLSDRGLAVDRDQVERDPVRCAKIASEMTGATVLLKGAATVVVGAEGSLYVQADGTPWLATAGSGDVLTGLLGALLAGHGLSVAIDPAMPARLAAAAALVHGRAALRASGDGPVGGRDDGTVGSPISAMDVVEALPGTIREILAAR